MALAQLAVFVRPPMEGIAKTRLAGLLGAHGAAALYAAFVEDTLRLCERVQAAGRVDVELWSTGPHDNAVSSWASRLGTKVRFQPQGDLGVKLAAAFEDGLQRYERIVIIGSDMPTLPIELIASAFEALENAPLVLGPANDGGYYAVGATRSIRPSFDRVRWSTVHALRDTAEANASHPIAQIAPWYDIDEPRDLALLRAHLSVDESAAPATARCLAELARAQR
jgi:rSAM/selenodomain-associated transferase 1